MTKGFKIHDGRSYRDPGGYYLTPRRAFLPNGEGDALIYHPDTGKPVAKFHSWMAWQWLVWASAYEGGGRDIFRDGMVVHLARGQCLYSLDYLGVAWGFKAKSSVSRLLARLEAAGRIRLDWPSFKYTEPNTVHSRATPSAARTDLVNPQSRLLTKREQKAGRQLQRKTQRLGRLITVLNYGTYQSVEFYSATPLATGRVRVARRSRDDRETNKKSLKLKKERPRAARSCPPSSQHPVDNTPEPVTWAAIRGALRLGVWSNLPAHIQVAHIQEAYDADPNIPEDLKALALTNGTPSPEADELARLRRVRTMLKGER